MCSIPPQDKLDMTTTNSILYITLLMTSSDLTETFCYKLADPLEHIYPLQLYAVSDFLSTSFRLYQIQTSNCHYHQNKMKMADKKGLPCSDRGKYLVLLTIRDFFECTSMQK